MTVECLLTSARAAATENQNQMGGLYTKSYNIIPSTHCDDCKMRTRMRERGIYIERGRGDRFKESKRERRVREKDSKEEIESKRERDPPL